MSDQNQEMIQYLLGQLWEEAQSRLASENFHEARRFEELVADENELVDGYARGRLSTADRARFEQHYLAHPDRGARARFAAALSERVNIHQPVKVDTASESSRWFGMKYRPAFAYAATMASVALLVLAIWLIFQP